MTVQISSKKELRDFVSQWANTLRGDELILLSGPLGVGKTEFVRALVESFGRGEVCSPTFAVLQKYQVGSQGFDHVDLYRLKGEADLDSTGFWDLFGESSSIIIVEWADQIDQELWPKLRRKWKINLSFVDSKPEARRIEIQGPLESPSLT